VFGPVRSFQPTSLMFADKVSSLPESEVHERCSAKKGSAGIARKHSIRLEKPPRDEHCSFLRNFVNYGRKKF